MLHFRAATGLRVDGRLLCGRACRSVLQTLRGSLTAASPAGPPLPPAHRLADRRALQTCLSSRQQEAANSLSPAERQEQKQKKKQQHEAAAEDTPAAVEPPSMQCSTTSAFGQVLAAQANFVRIKVDALEGAASPDETPPRPRLLCVVRALLKKMRQAVLVGDRVKVVGIDWADGRGMVEEVLPRTSRLFEPAVANVDHVLLVFSAALPGFQPSPATRYLLSAEAAWLPVTVAINKADLMSPEEVQTVVEQVDNWGYRAVAVSVVSGEGLDALTEALAGRVTVVAGPSGAGKSSIINALRMRSLGLDSTLEAMAAEPSGAEHAEEEEEEEEEEGGFCGEVEDGAEAEAQQEEQRPQNGAQPPAGDVQQQAGGGGGPSAQRQRQHSADSSGSSGSTKSSSSSSSNGSLPGGTRQSRADLELQAVGQVSERIGRGKHTTRNVTLLQLEGSGGGLVVDTPGFNQPTLDFPSVDLWQHFPEIRQLLEEDRCAFRGCQHLVEPGCVVREAGWERYPLYAEIHAELKTLEEQTMQRQASKKKREGAVRMKSRAGGQQGAEARLETKTHRRVSRRSVKQKLTELVRDVEDDEAFLK